MGLYRFQAAAKRAAIVVGLIVVSACSSDPAPRGPIIARPSQQSVEPTPPPTNDRYNNQQGYNEARRYDRRGYVEPLHMEDNKPVRVGLLLPFTADSKAVQRVASSMFDAAQLAAFEAADERFLLIPKDTKGTPCLLYTSPSPRDS